MKILIIGAKGMLGSMLMQVLADYQPMGWDREEIDVTNEVQVFRKIGEVRPEVIINAAAYTNVDAAESERDIALAVNADGPKFLALAAREVGSKFIHYSTDYIFPGTSQDGYDEGAAAGPAVNFYGETKLKGEEAVTSSGADWYIMRTAWLYGPNGKNFVETMVRLGKEKPEIRVVADQHGSPTFTKDVALATRQLLEKGMPSGVYHAVCQGQATWYEFAQEIFRLMDMPVTVMPISSDEYPLPAKRPVYSVLLNTKGLVARDWQEALTEYVTAYRQV